MAKEIVWFVVAVVGADVEDAMGIAKSFLKTIIAELRSDG